MNETSRVKVRKVDLGDPGEAAALLELLDGYARDPMGGGNGLSPEVKGRLVDQLRHQTHFHGALAWVDGEAVGLIDCFLGFSTFAARPLLNIHDIAVRREWRGQGVGRMLVAWAESHARELGCCKLTLEVLSNNKVALGAYERAGFAPYCLDPAAGQALFMQKLL